MSDLETLGIAVPSPVLFRDAPTDLELDAFGHRSYASSVVAALNVAKQPFTLGLLGPWGVGKSSVLRRIKRTMDSGESVAVVVDAWRYDSASLRRQLLRDVSTELIYRDALDRTRFDPACRLESLVSDRQTTKFVTRPSVGGTVLSIAQAFLAGGGTYGLLQLAAVRDLFAASGASPAAPISAGVAAILLCVSLVGQAFRAVPTVTTTRRAEDAEVFDELFRDMVAATTAPRLVVAIDNLDRCSPSDALDLLATIKTYLEPAAQEAKLSRGVSTEVLFVLAVDEQALMRHLRAQGDLGDDAADYLRKIFSATVRFGPLLRADLSGLESDV